MRNSRNGLQLRLGNIAKDEKGFDDLDEFWDAPELTNNTSESRSSLSPEKKRNSGLSSVADEDVFDYDTGNSISEEESEPEEEIVPEIVVDEVPLAKSPSRGRRSTLNNSLGSAMPFEDSPSMLGSSPFEGGISPVDRRKSSVLANPALNSGSKVREGAKGRAGPSLGEGSMSPQRSPARRKSAEKSSPGSAEKNGASPSSTNVVTYDDVAMQNDHYEDAADVGGHDADFTVDEGMEVDESAASSASNGRRVSFGQEAKAQIEAAPSSSSATKRGRGRPPAKARTPDVDVERKRNTPDSSRSSKSNISTPGSNDFPRGHQMLDDTFENSDEDARDKTDRQDSDSDEENDTSGYANDSFASTMRNKKKSRDDDYDDDNAYEGTRRSKRGTKGKRLAFWKNERIIYEGGKMVGVLALNPTPKKVTGKLMKNGRKVSKRLIAGSDDDDDESSHPVKHEAPIVLPSDVKFLSSEEGNNILLWDSFSKKPQVMNIVSHKDQRESTRLPITGPRAPGKTAVASAAQHFHIPQVNAKSSSWISGSLELPPGAIKDAEGIGPVTQVFFVSDCQDNAIEVAIGDPTQEEFIPEKAQRQLFSKGDSFYVPSFNVYRLENHSADRTCVIFWTIIKDPENEDVPAISSSE